MILDVLREPFKSKKALGAILLGAIAVSSTLAVIETKLDNNRLNRIYQQSGGTNASASKLEKVNFIRLQPDYNPTNENSRFLEYTHAHSLPNPETPFKDLKYLFSKD